ncbi:unnamed protein product [Ilex paraguariensis]|uniref:Thioredoxin-like protein AAED1, chloroplastic n=1 Tax=Ilex paraguariensis TaxID=185542 RepID=A0ABC8TGC1_9AQUA
MCHVCNFPFHKPHWFSPHPQNSNGHDVSTGALLLPSPPRTPPSMALSLHTYIPYSNIQPYKNTHYLQASLISKVSQPYNPNRNKTINLSPSKRVITVSAISSSPGIDSSVMSEENKNLLDSVEVFDLNGNGIPISDLWKDRKAVVAFARHFGCVLCRKRADYLAAKKDTMDAYGVALVLIGPGSVDQASSNETSSLS